MAPAATLAYYEKLLSHGKQQCTAERDVDQSRKVTHCNVRAGAERAIGYCWSDGCTAVQHLPEIDWALLHTGCAGAIPVQTEVGVSESLLPVNLQQSR